MYDNPITTLGEMIFGSWYVFRRLIDDGPHIFDDQLLHCILSLPYGQIFTVSVGFEGKDLDLRHI